MPRRSNRLVFIWRFDHLTGCGRLFGRFVRCCHVAQCERPSRRRPSPGDSASGRGGHTRTMSEIVSDACARLPLLNKGGKAAARIAQARFSPPVRSTRPLPSSRSNYRAGSCADSLTTRANGTAPSPSSRTCRWSLMTPLMRITRFCRWQFCLCFSMRDTTVLRAESNCAAGPARAGAHRLLRQLRLRIDLTRNVAQSGHPAQPRFGAGAGPLLLRIVILSIFAALGRQGFGKTIEPLLTLATCYCILIGGIRREAPLGHVLTHYDEAAAYALGAGLASWIA